MAIELGKLYQYKREYLGFAYKSCPRTPYADADHKIAAHSEFVGMKEYKEQLAKTAPWEKGFYPYKTEKMLVFPCSVITVCHPRLKSIQGTYLRALVSTNRNEEWAPHWLRDEWIEPLDGEPTESYEETLGKRCWSIAKDFLEKKKLEREELPEKSPKDVFLEMMKRKEGSPKK